MMSRKPVCTRLSRDAQINIDAAKIQMPELQWDDEFVEEAILAASEDPCFLETCKTTDTQYEISEEAIEALNKMSAEYNLNFSDLINAILENTYVGKRVMVG